MPATPTRRWSQPRLTPLAPLVSARLHLQYDGPGGTLTVGYRIEDFATDELLAMGCVPIIAPRMEARELGATVEWIHQLVQTHLSPF